jgi:hypothetical protein
MSEHSWGNEQSQSKVNIENIKKSIEKNTMEAKLMTDNLDVEVLVIGVEKIDCIKIKKDYKKWLTKKKKCSIINNERSDKNVTSWKYRNWKLFCIQ